MKILLLSIIVFLLVVQPLASFAEDVSITARVAGCGDGIVIDPEQCDGLDLNNSTCVSRGFASGSLYCSSECLIVTVNCKSGGGVPVLFGGLNGFNPVLPGQALPKVVVIDFLQMELTSRLRVIISELKSLIDNLKQINTSNQFKNVVYSGANSTVRILNDTGYGLVNSLKLRLSEFKNFFKRILASL